MSLFHKHRWTKWSKPENFGNGFDDLIHRDDVVDLIKRKLDV